MRRLGLTLDSAMKQANEQGVPIADLQAGESVTFQAYGTVARAAQSVTVTKGEDIYYSSYGYGSYLTCEFTVSFGSVSAKSLLRGTIQSISRKRKLFHQ